MKLYKNKKKKGSLILLTSCFLLIVILINSTFDLLLNKKHESNTNILENNSANYLDEDKIVELNLKEHSDTIIFFANTFQIDVDKLLEKLKENISEIEFDNFDQSLVKYLFNLEKKEKNLFNRKITPCIDDKDYMVALIKYYTNIYPSVDFTIAASIAQIESNYKSPGMLRKNNIFGGMANGKLLGYKNIEYGILKYIKLLNDGYFNKGLTTIEAIGKKYNPRIVNGKKIASPTWLSNVTKATNAFKDHDEVDINILNLLKSN